MPSLMYQYVTNLVVRLPIRSGPGTFMNIPVRENGSLKTRIWSGEGYYSNTLIIINPLNAELHPICHLLALLGAHHIFHVSRTRVNPM
jgi:hypothetical protein